MAAPDQGGKRASEGVRYVPDPDQYESEPEAHAPMMEHYAYTAPPGERYDPNQLAKMANDNPAPTGFLAWAGFGCTIFSLAALCIAFASPYWLQTYPNSFNTFRNIGLWEVCMDNYMHHKDDSQEIYSGCWWVFSREKKYTKLIEWLLPRKYGHIFHIYWVYMDIFLVKQVDIHIENTPGEPPWPSKVI